MKKNKLINKLIIDFEKSLNIKFDVYESESQYYEFAKQIVKLLVDRHLATKL